MAVSSDSPITAKAPPASEAIGARRTPPPQIVATDGELLTQFLGREDPVALDRLIERHSAMVWRVCRATLRRPQDVEDAFQATFLLLVKNAGSIKSSESAAGWLYRVAYRTSLRARKKLAARREEALAVDPHAPSEHAFPDLLQKQTTGVLVEELMRLPAKYQTPLVLRYLEGQSRRAIADQTDTTIAAVQGRLARGKQMLRRRLLRRGVSLAAAMGALGLGARGAAAAENAPARVLAQTTTNSTALAGGGSVAASAGVLSLFQEGVRAMLAVSIGKPLASVAALVAAALLLMPPGEAGDALPSAAPAAAIQLEAELPEPTAQSPGAVKLAQAKGDASVDGEPPRDERGNVKIDVLVDPKDLIESERGWVETQRRYYMALAEEDGRAGGYEQPSFRELLMMHRYWTHKNHLAEKERKRLNALGMQLSLESTEEERRVVTDHVDESIAAWNLAQARLAELERKLKHAALAEKASRRRESSENSAVGTPPTGVEGSPVDDKPLQQLGTRQAPDRIRAKLLAQLDYIKGIQIEVTEVGGEIDASIAAPSTYIEAVHRLEHPDEAIDKSALAATRKRVIAQIEQIAMPLLPRLALRENEYKQANVWVYTAPTPDSPTESKLHPIKSDKKPSEPQPTEPPKWPVIVETVPEHGATDVDPGLAEVRVTFDRDMGGGMSWTGNKQSFMPDVPPGAKARWIDKRTCVLPVKLARGEFYRVGINAKSYQNFQSADGVPAAHGAIAFATKGAKRSVARRVRTPKVVEMAPAADDASVSPGLKKLRVTFDMKMGGGMSWTNTDAGPFPETGGGRAAWSRDGRTCTLPVKLSPDQEYAVGLNASHAVNFQSEHGVPLPPVVWKFTTAEGLAAYQYGPDSKMKQGQWNCLHKPTALNPIGWATVAQLEEGEHAPIKLPADARPRPHVKFLGMKEQVAQFEIVDLGHEQHGQVWDGGAPTRIRGVPVEFRLIEWAHPDAPPLFVIRRVPVGAGGEFEPLGDLPTIEEAKELLSPSRQTAGVSGRAEPSDDRLAATRAPGRIDHTDGKADGKKSLGGSGHLIRFELPEGAIGVKSLRIHGSRYGTKTAPREDFEISFLNEDRSEILDIRRGAYGLFRRGQEKWTNVRFKDPVVDLPKTFWVAIDFNPGRTKGVYLSYDASTGGERSMTGLAQQQPDEHQPVEFGGDWMVSPVLVRDDGVSLSLPEEPRPAEAETLTL